MNQMPRIISQLRGLVTEFLHLWIENVSFSGHFDSIDYCLRASLMFLAIALAFAAAHAQFKYSDWSAITTIICI
jgi:hypothetical protein